MSKSVFDYFIFKAKKRKKKVQGAIKLEGEGVRRTFLWPGLPPPPRDNVSWNVEKKVPKKELFSLMARPLREELFLRLPLPTHISASEQDIF